MPTAPLDEVRGAGTIVQPWAGFAGPLVVGKSDHDYVCGFCGTLLGQDLEEGQVLGFFECPSCHRAAEFR